MLIKYKDALDTMLKLEEVVQAIPGVARAAVKHYLERAELEDAAAIEAAGEVLILAFHEHDEIIEAATVLRNEISEAEKRAGAHNGKAERKRLQQSAALWATIASNKSARLPAALRKRAATKVRNARAALKDTPEVRGDFEYLGVSVTDEMYQFLLTRDLVTNQTAPYVMQSGHGS